MLKRKNVIIMLLFTATCCLGGCSLLNIAKPNPPEKKPTTVPIISEPVTPTPIIPDATTVPIENSGTPVPETTHTPAPTATPTPTPSPTPIPTVPPAPATLNVDTSTYTFLINRDYPLTADYCPDDLVVPDIKFSFNDLTADKRKLRKVAADALTELCAAALAEEGLTIYGVSGYRSYDRQYDIYGSNIITSGIRHTNLYSAAPGNSEHQTGLSIDVSCKEVGYGLIERFAETAEGVWLKENCWRFGFILRYPKEKEHITGYAYEPWHIRYVGIPLAYYLYTNDLTLEEYYGSPSSHTLEELKDKPLISLNTNRFYKLYAKTMGSELYYLADGSIWVSEVTSLPYLKEVVRDTAGNAIKVDGSPFFVEPVRDTDGNMVLDNNAEICYTKPYFTADGSLWINCDGAPVYLQPLWNANGTLARDSKGNLLYTEPLTDSFGLEVVTETGSLILKVPIRDSNGELTYNADGTVAFYEPFVNPTTGEFIPDSATGLPLYPSDYYLVPHNTYPLPEGYLSEEPEITPNPGNEPTPEPEEPQEPDYSDEDWWNYEETGGFPE